MIPDYPEWSNHSVQIDRAARFLTKFNNCTYQINLYAYPKEVMFFCIRNGQMIMLRQHVGDRSDEIAEDIKQNLENYVMEDLL